MHCCLFAVDGGPRETLAALASQEGFDWEEGGVDNVILGRADCFKARRMDAVVVGTSRSENGARQEACFRMAAKRLGLPVVAIEDYPGNYLDIEQGAADLLIVESEPAAALARAKLGGLCPRIVIGSSLRYDNRRTSAPDVVHTGKAPRVLWIGQPETEDALHTLRNLLPHLTGLGVELLFRPHPRDEGYPRGDYQALFEAHGCATRDVSDLDLAAILELAPCLSLTQFSSLAIELGFLGIPMLHVLYPEAGQRRLRALTGYGVPLVCRAGGSDTITAANETGRKLRQAIFDGEARRLAMQRFCAYFEVETPQADRVAASIRHFLEQQTAHQSKVK